MIDDYSKLKDELKSLYPEDYETKDYDSLFTGASGGIESAEKLIREKKGGNLLQRLKGCSPGNSDWKTFEDVCLDLVKLTFENNEFFEAEAMPQLPNKYVPLDEKGTRKDITIPLVTKKRMDLDKAIIWDEFRSEPYDCKYLIFDAKNYNGPIKDKEIYQMFHYLNPKKGRIGIIFSRKSSVDESGKAALRRIKDDNYIIFVLTDDDVIKWIDCYTRDGSVRTYFRTLLTIYDSSF